MIPVRVVLVTFLFTLIAFALSLLLGIIALLITGRLRGVHPNMTVAYRYIAIPSAAAIAAFTLIVVSVTEFRNYRQSKALREIEAASR
jgi:TctA family transporter